jgi:hypothetical protein
MHFH